MGLEDIPLYFRYWGKANNTSEVEGETYHLLVYHCLDVAAVGWLLLEPSKTLCKDLAKQLGVEEKWLQQWFCFCLMLHDLGKFCRGFQNLVSGLSPELVSYDAGSSYDIRHDTLGFLLWQKELLTLLVDVFPDRKLNRTKITPWLEIVCGHHGQPPRKDIRQVKTYLKPEEDILAAEAYVREVIKHWLPDLSPLSNIDVKIFKQISWQFAGVAVLADWLGSDNTFFKYQSKYECLSEYWKKTAVISAKNMLKNSAFQPKQTTSFKNIQQQFDFIQQSTPLQAYAESIEINDTPQLFILEDVTGAGKTEAAMVLVHRLMSQGLASGLYVGLPTMATANGMYSRLAKSYQCLFQGENKPSLVLAHGASQFSENFQESICLSNQLQDKNYLADELSAGTYCNQWLADSRKKSLLADVGIGTIDQALLAVLPASHQSLRMLGLRDKVLVVDEVHAYDPYMRQLLSSLLQAHAIQGGSAILLSATLPQQFRQELTASYLRGLGFQAPQLVNTEDYPLVTQCCDDKLVETPIETRCCVKRVVKVSRLEDEASALALIKKTIQSGQSICWVRNTVKDARNAYENIQENKEIPIENIHLFHSRFVMADRQAIESDVLAHFGKHSTGKMRSSRILIATQVVEQSLDLDFDVMISDLAPVDLLIQRAGRLQRHIRDENGDRLYTEGKNDQRAMPCLYLLAPDPEQVDNSQWLRSLLSGSQSVYGNVGQLWLTAKLLLQKQQFRMPEDARELVEGVYGTAAQDMIPEHLEQDSWAAEAQNKARKSMGVFNQLDLAKGYCLESAEHNAGWSKDTHIPARLTEAETISVVLVKVDANNQLQPYAFSSNQNHQWALSQISLPEKDWLQAQALIPERWNTDIERLKQKHKKLKWIEVLPLVTETQHLYQSEGGWNLERK